MDNYNNIIAIAIFALYSFVFSLFMLPIINNLREIQYRLRGLIKPQTILKEEKQTEKDEQTTKLYNILNEYKLEYQELYKLKEILVYGGIITVLTIVILFLILNWTNIILFFGKIYVDNTIVYWHIIPWIAIIKTIYIVIMIILIIFALKKYIPSIGKITEWSYMVKHFSFSPSGIARYSNIYIDYNIKDEEGFRSIRICSDIEIRGYKYRFFIYDNQNGNCIYSIIGQIKNNTKLFEMFPDIDDFKTRYTIIGKFDTDKFKGKQLKMNFFIFDPCIMKEPSSPYGGFQDFEFEENVLSSTRYAVYPNASIYKRIKYEGNNLSFKKKYRESENNENEIDRKIKCIFNNEKRKL